MEWPSLLQLNQDKWLQTEFSSHMDQAIQLELVKKAPAVSYAFSVTGVDTVCPLNSVIDCTCFSDAIRLLRVTALVLCFIKKSQVRRPIYNKRNHKQNLLFQLSVDEISAAELLWIRFIQVNAFQAEIKFLLSGKPPKPIRVDQFQLKMDDNKLLKCQGRIGNSSLPLSSNEPIILPSNYYFARLLILDAPDKVKHSGVNDTLTMLREYFWILKGRQAVKKVFTKLCYMSQVLRASISFSQLT